MELAQSSSGPGKIPTGRALALPATVFALGLAVPACIVGPDYEKPGTGKPSVWDKQEARTKAGLTAASDPNPKWWRALGDADLERLVRRAVRRNQDLVRATQRARKARSLIGVAEARLQPVIGAGGSYSRARISENFPVLDRFIQSGQVSPRQDLYSATFDAGWEIDFFGGARRGVQAASARAEAAEAGRRQVLLTVVAETAQNYVVLRRSQAQAAALERSIALQQETAALARRQKSSGTGTQLEVERSLAGLRTLEARLPAILGREAAAAYRLAVLTADAPAALYQKFAVRKPVPAPPDLVPTGLPGSMLKRRPDVLRAERMLAAAVAEVGVNVARLYPRFSLTGVAGSQASSFTDLADSGSGTWMIVPGMNWELFQGGAIRASIEAAQAGSQEALAGYRSTILEAVGEAEGALTRYARAFESRGKTEAAVRHLEASVELVRKAHEAGVSSFFEVLEAQRRLADGRQELASARAEVLLALVSLNKALGGGWTA